MSGSEKLHFFDIKSTLPGSSQSWSPNTVRTRLALNYKGIPYSQSFISYPDIAPLLQSLHVPPIAYQPNMPYTLPAIKHASVPGEGHTMADSFPIALHLEKTFPAPEYPSLFPTSASYTLAVAVGAIISNGLHKAGFSFIVAGVWNILDAPRGQEYFRRTREKRVGKPLEEVCPAKSTKEWEDTKNAIVTWLKPLADMLRGMPGHEKKGPFFEGEKAGYADFMLVAYFAWFERANKEIFEIIINAGDGKFKDLWETCQPWLNGQGEEVEWKI